MNNIYIQNVRPNTVNPEGGTPSGAYVYYNVAFNVASHSVSGNFLASDEDVKNAEADTTGGVWDGFKKLVVNRLANDAAALKQSN